MTFTCHCGRTMYYDMGLDALSCPLHAYCGWKHCPGRDVNIPMNQYASSAGALLHDDCDLERARNHA